MSVGGRKSSAMPNQIRARRLVQAVLDLPFGVFLVVYLKSAARAKGETTLHHAFKKYITDMLY